MTSATPRTEEPTTGTQRRIVAPHVAVTLSDLVDGDQAARSQLENILTDEHRRGAALLPDPLPAVPARRAAYPGLTDLDEPARRILLTAAVAVVDRTEVLLAAAGADIDDLVSGPAGAYLHLAGGRFRFRNPCVRQIVHDDADLAARTAVHSGLAGVLRVVGRPEVALWHTALSTMAGDSLLADGLVELAERHLLRGDTARAHEVAREAASQGVGETRSRASLVASRAALLGGHLADAIAWARQSGRSGSVLAAALAFADGDPNPGLADVVVSERDREALWSAVRALAVIHDKPAEAAELLAEVLPDAATTRPAEAWFTAPPRATPLVEAHLRVVQALIAMRFGDLDRAAEVLTEAAGRLPVALVLGGLGVAVARRLDLVRTGVVSATTRALEAAATGSTTGTVRAAMLGDRALEAAQAGRDVQAATFLGLAAERGGVELRAWWLPTPDPVEIYMGAGQQRAARRHLTMLRNAVLGPNRIARGVSLRFRLDLARAEVALAEQGTFQRAADHAVEVSQEVGSTFERGLTEVVVSRALERLGRDAEAAAHLLAARALFAESGALAFLPDRLPAASRGSARSARLSPTTRPGRVGTSTASEKVEVGRERAGQELTPSEPGGGGNVTPLDPNRSERTTWTVQQDPCAHWDGLLTERELDVARLVAEGRTNRQVAEKLYVSVRTVEVHLGRVFRKLGVRSRTELAVLAFRTA